MKSYFLIVGVCMSVTLSAVSSGEIKPAKIAEHDVIEKKEEQPVEVHGTLGSHKVTVLSPEEDAKVQEAVILEQRSPSKIFVNSDWSLTDRAIEILTIDKLYEKGDTLSSAVKKTQSVWISVLQGKGKKERSDLQDSQERVALKESIEQWATSVEFFSERTPALQHYTYAAWHGAFLDGVRRNLFQLVEAWKRGIRFDYLVGLSGERYLRKQEGGQDELSRLLDEKQSPLPFKKDWTMPADAPYETEYDMIKLVWSQVQLPEDMAAALEGKITFVNAPRGDKERPGTKDTFATWLKEYHPQRGTIIACSYPLLWSYQQLVGETALLDTGLTVDTIAPALSEKDRQMYGEKIVSLVFDTTAKCLYEIDQKKQLQSQGVK